MQRGLIRAASTEPDCEGGHLYDADRGGIQDCAQCGAPLLFRVVPAGQCCEG